MTEARTMGTMHRILQLMVDKKASDVYLSAYAPGCWRVGDLVMWDNRCTMHRGTDYDERRWRRDMGRATVSDIGNTVELARAQALAA